MQQHSIYVTLYAPCCQLSFVPLSRNSLSQLSFATLLCRSFAIQNCKRELQTRLARECYKRELLFSSFAIQSYCKRAVHEVSGRCATKEVSALFQYRKSLRHTTEYCKRAEFCTHRAHLKDHRALVRKDFLPNHKFLFKLDRIFGPLMTEIDIGCLRLVGSSKS